MITTIQNIIHYVFILFLLAACSDLMYVTDKDGNKQLYKMRIMDFGTTISSSQLFSYNITYDDNFPDVSIDTSKLVYSSIRSGQNVIVVRDLSNDTSTAEQIIQTSATTKFIMPRWSCQQDLISYAESTPSSDDTKIKIVRADGSGSPVLVTSPGTYAGHDWGYKSKYIIYSSQISNTPTPDTYGLSLVKLDGTVIGPFVQGELPTISHSGDLLAYVQRLEVGPGTPERIVVANAETLMPMHQFSLQAPYGGRKIGAIGFTGDDNGLYIATEVPDVSATTNSKSYEIFRVNLDGTKKVRLTDNNYYDSQPDGIPAKPIPLCMRCVDIPSEQETPSLQSITINGVLFKAATLPSGSPSSIAITDYCPRNEGKRELKIGWSELSAGSGQFASITFPHNLFGDGPSSVKVTACHSNQLSLKAYDKNHNLVAEIPHTAGQNTLQTLNLNGGKISRIDIIGSEIGIRDVCFSP